LAAKIEDHKDELFPLVGFAVPNLRRSSCRVMTFYNERGTDEHWIKKGEIAVKWTRLICLDFVGNQQNSLGNGTR